MRSFAVLATIYAATFGTASADSSCLTSGTINAIAKTTIDVNANGYDTRTSGDGCSPSGCVAENTRDKSYEPNSRWSCKGDILDSSDDDEGCCIRYSFDEPQDLLSVRMAFHKGDENTRTLDVFNNGDYYSTITSSGSTLSVQNFDLDTDETKELKLCLHDPQSYPDVWLSITEVFFRVCYLK